MLIANIPDKNQSEGDVHIQLSFKNTVYIGLYFGKVDLSRRFGDVTGDVNNNNIGRIL